MPYLRLTHSLVRQTRKLLRVAKPDDRGMLWPPKSCLHIRVSRTALKRALRIMHALLDAMKTRGWTVRVAADVDSLRPLVSRTFVTVLDEEIAFGLEERSKQVPHVLTGYEKDSIKTRLSALSPPMGSRSVRCLGASDRDRLAPEGVQRQPKATT